MHNVPSAPIKGNSVVLQAASIGGELAQTQKVDCRSAGRAPNFELEAPERPMLMALESNDIFKLGQVVAFVPDDLGLRGPKGQGSRPPYRALSVRSLSTKTKVIHNLRDASHRAPAAEGGIRSLTNANYVTCIVVVRQCLTYSGHSLGSWCRWGARGNFPCVFFTFSRHQPCSKPPDPEPRF